MHILADIQLLMPAEYIVSMLTYIKTYGQACKYINDPSLMPDLRWETSSVDRNVNKNVNTTKHKYIFFTITSIVVIRIVVIKNIPEDFRSCISV